jgi:hypothetical protein
MDKYLITSVTGFNLKSDIMGKDGSLLPSGFTTKCIPLERPEIIPRFTNKKFFTNFNSALLQKVLDYKRINE